jgi:hypothetical protein
MSSFLDSINLLVTALEINATLAAFAQEKWRKSVTVRKGFKRREEISTTILPVILISRPSIKKSFQIGNGREGANLVRLYAGFFQKDPRKGVEEIIQYEELLDDILSDMNPGEIGAIGIDPEVSTNDEGKYHPSYFTVMDVEITHER